MHRFFVSPQAISREQVVFGDEHGHQIRDVLRLKVGEQIVILDNAGSEYTIALFEITRRAVRGRVLSSGPAKGEPRSRLILYQGLLKRDKFEWVLQKGAELGITEFVPMVTARSIADSVSKLKTERWGKILIEAAEQAGRGKIPALRAVQSFADVMKSGRDGLSLIPWEEERSFDLRSALDAPIATSVHLFVGPEGGFTPAEIERAVAAGIRTITLGPRILRAETAGLVAASAIFFAYGELKAF